MSYKKQKIFLVAAFLFVPLLLLVVFTYLPVINIIWYSLNDWNGLSPMEFCWFDNYIEIFSDPEYFLVLFNSIYYLAGSVVQMALGLFFAVLLSFRVRFKGFFKGTMFFPYLINGVAVGLIFVFFFRTDGTLNLILQNLFGVEKAQNFLENAPMNNVLLAGVSVWRYMGFNLVMFIGAIQSVSPELYEAAEMDGAGKLRIFFSIIFPMIKSIIALNLILAVKGAVSVFEVPYIMTKGSFETSTFVIRTIELGIKNPRRQIGLASALSMVLFLIIMAVTAIQKLLFKEKSED